MEHEIEILKQIKNENPLFVPRYYIPNNKNNYLLMDYIDSKTLTEFIEAFRGHLSLLTKLFLMFTISQSMRYLKEHNIVHLDLKPSNILMHQKMLIKLIDFGESYHPQVNDYGIHHPYAGFVPGFTVPYSSPELFSNSKSFSSKSDVFSMGVIFFELLYNKSPFTVFTRTTNMEESMKNFQLLWFLSPE